MVDDLKGEDKLLQLLRGHGGETVSGSVLSGHLGVSRTAVWKWVNLLRRRGYRIESTPSRGYAFLGAPDIPLAGEVGHGLDTRVMGCRIRYLKEIDSTNRLAMDLGRGGEPEGTVVVAESQTEGKGRLGRTWVSPAGWNLYFSVLLRPPISPEGLARITLVTAVSLCRTLRAETALPVQIKWPNDLWVRGKKVGGILAEMSADMDQVRFAVVGVGINVNLPAEALPPRLRKTAISLSNAAGRTFSRVALLQALLMAMDRDYELFCREGFVPFRDQWTQLSMTSGQKVQVALPGETIQGTAVGISAQGALQVKRRDGVLHDVVSGDVSLMPEGRE